MMIMNELVGHVGIIRCGLIAFGVIGKVVFFLVPSQVLDMMKAKSTTQHSMG